MEEGWKWGKPISHERYLQAKECNWDVLLTPTKAVSHHWFGDLRGKKVLGLASGDGQQMPIFAASGAICTEFDYTPAQLESEKIVAAREGYGIDIIRGDMSESLPFEKDTFDLIFLPVSTCYIEKVAPLFSECYRNLKPQGIFLAGLETEVNFLMDEEEEHFIFSAPFNPLKNEEHRKYCMEVDAGYQSSHSIEENIGGLLKAGFLFTDLKGDTNGEGRLHELNIGTYMMIRSINPTYPLGHAEDK